jgi:ribose-phosphate pyrophosphokinase
MVTFNNKNVVKGKFPNNEVEYLPITEDICYKNCPDEFELIFESNEDLFNLQVAKKMWDDIPEDDRSGFATLYMQFCPYSQMDRPMQSHGFSLKAVADLINELNFSTVVIADPHSPVVSALIKRSNIWYPIKDFLEAHEAANEGLSRWDLMFFPDASACKKYSEILECKNYRFGNKKRNLDTGEIECYEIIASDEDIKGKDILIVDDLCMGGRTFAEAAKALHEKGASNIDLYITHLMPQSSKFIKDCVNGAHHIRAVYSFDSLNILRKDKICETVTIA